MNIYKRRSTDRLLLVLMRGSRHKLRLYQESHLSTITLTMPWQLIKIVSSDKRIATAIFNSAAVVVEA